jgi:hypothetical protein
MAFPTVVATSHGPDVTADATSITLDLPDGSNVRGRLLIVAVSKDGSGAVTWPTGWTVLNDGASDASAVYQSVRYRIIDGSEGYPATGATITCTGASEEWASWGFLISGFHTATTPEAASATGTSAAADPPALTPSWGAQDCLWIVCVSLDGEPAISDHPYADGQNSDNTVGLPTAVAHARCSQLLNAATSDPAAYTNTSTSWRAVTIAVVSSSALLPASAVSLTLTPATTDSLTLTPA